MKTIVTPSLTLEPQLAAHAPEMFSVLSDPAIYEFENEPPVNVEWLTTRFERLERRTSPDGSEHWLNWVIRLESGALAGYVRIPFDMNTKSSDVLARRYLCQKHPIRSEEINHERKQWDGRPHL